MYLGGKRDIPSMVTPIIFEQLEIIRDSIGVFKLKKIVILVIEEFGCFFLLSRIVKIGKNSCM